MSDLGGSKQAVVFEEAERLGSELEKLGGAISELKERLDSVMSDQSVCDKNGEPSPQVPAVCRVAEKFRSTRYLVVDILNNVKDIISRLEI
jgi:hypothetical protein